MLNKFELDDFIKAALKEDIALGDITTDSLIDKASTSTAVYIAKDDGIIAGLFVSERVFKILDEEIEFMKKVNDGDRVKKGDIIAQIKGSTSALLKAERTSLNYLQHLSGIATKTGMFAEKLEGLNTKVVDTRKTTPGLRALEKYAVKMGGGSNHRFCLSDGVLIKDNHIKAAGGVKQAIEKVRQNIPHTIKIEVETETIEQVREAISAKADIIMLDNMSLDQMKDAVQLIDRRATVEASGNVSLDFIRQIAETGVDIISVGELTHTVKAFDISMRFV
ncbi:carboxylating nicotinate-nucleotide diphosphorylase [Pseudobacteroides cellulosolvens]|uniref:Probable nicotinate-nucleotide pyrophosphorylase [carboxylating] n=1 Tax=Pseudobacteroides cellulosolvens ATCC 35603 = DSM 2933 TaxID=398512 RepID=A0A0L6JV52_9FIRM|nr:carboxylating nicotinate-nucleotide diphosphorylase [Pseudobacteroides cellulosolvens]KNY29721.1 nicotinate-nucleotide pyrophosphorylase [Pseudobacteroides cellulosolvens ATCC 35603 = DSM 2933]